MWTARYSGALDNRHFLVSADGSQAALAAHNEPCDSGLGYSSPIVDPDSWG